MAPIKEVVGPIKEIKEPRLDRIHFNGAALCASKCHGGLLDLERAKLTGCMRECIRAGGGGGGGSPADRCDRVGCVAADVALAGDCPSGCKGECQPLWEFTEYPNLGDCISDMVGGGRVCVCGGEGVRRRGMRAAAARPCGRALCPARGLHQVLCAKADPAPPCPHPPPAPQAIAANRGQGPDNGSP